MHKPERATRKPKTNSLIMEKSEVDKMIDIFFGTGSQDWVFSRNSKFGYKTFITRWRE